MKLNHHSIEAQFNYENLLELSVCSLDARKVFIINAFNILFAAAAVAQHFLLALHKRYLRGNKCKKKT